MLCVLFLICREFAARRSQCARERERVRQTDRDTDVRRPYRHDTLSYSASVCVHSHLHRQQRQRQRRDTMPHCRTYAKLAGAGVNNSIRANRVSARSVMHSPKSSSSSSSCYMDSARLSTCAWRVCVFLASDDDGCSRRDRAIVVCTRCSLLADFAAHAAFAGRM